MIIEKKEEKGEKEKKLFLHLHHTHKHKRPKNTRGAFTCHAATWKKGSLRPEEEGMQSFCQNQGSSFLFCQQSLAKNLCVQILVGKNGQCLHFGSAYLLGGTPWLILPWRLKTIPQRKSSCTFCAGRRHPSTMEVQHCPLLLVQQQPVQWLLG